MPEVGAVEPVEVERLEDCPCCGELTHGEDFRVVDGLRFCAWCDENGCSKDVLDDEDEA